MAKWEIKVYANPARAGILHAGSASRFIACERDHAASEKAGKHLFAPHPRPQTISLPEGHKDIAYYARAVRDGDLYAADAATIEKCGGGKLIPADLLEQHVEKLEAQAKAAAAEAAEHEKKLAASKADEEKAAAAAKEDDAKRENLAKRLAALEPKAEAPKASEHDHIPLESIETEPPPHAA